MAPSSPRARPGPPRALSFAVRLLVALLGLLSLTGCNVVALRQASLERTFREAGLQPGERRFGPDTISYWAGGKGTPIVLLHGFGASAIWQWPDQVRNLARDHRVIVPDLLWFGDSRSDLPDYGIDHQVRAVEALLDALGAGRADVVGISYGGLVAHELAADRPAAVIHLAIVDSPGRVYTRADYAALCRQLGVEHLGDVLVPADPSGVERLLALAYDDPPWTPDFALQQSFEAFYTTRRAERVALLDALLAQMDELVARPTRITSKVEVIWGRDDPVFPLPIGERLAASFHTEVEVIDHARHAPNLEHPQLFNRMLRRFLGR
ncbi:MAG: alpha/beta hydrolase [Byssovorax sp.]